MENIGRKELLDLLEEIKADRSIAWRESDPVRDVLEKLIVLLLGEVK